MRNEEINASFLQQNYQSYKNVVYKLKKENYFNIPTKVVLVELFNYH